MNWPVLRHGDIRGNYKADEPAKCGATIELTDKFPTLGILLKISRFIIENTVVNPVSVRCATSDMDSAAKIKQTVYEKSTYTPKNDARYEH